MSSMPISAAALDAALGSDSPADLLSAALADQPTTSIPEPTGDVLEPETGVLAIGSGGNYAKAAATALTENTELCPEDVVRKAMTIAGDICIYTNHSLTLETLSTDDS